MTETNQFIIKALEHLLEKVPYIKVRYEYDEQLQSHFIDIYSHSPYHSDSNYLEFEQYLFEYLLFNYPLEGISFGDGDRFYEMGAPIFDREGRTYGFVDNCLSYKYQLNSITFGDGFYGMSATIFDKSGKEPYHFVEIATLSNVKPVEIQSIEGINIVCISEQAGETSFSLAA